MSTKSTAVATTGNAALPAFLQGYKGPLGTEALDQKDITIPRLKIGQSMNPEVKDGLVKEGALFLNATGSAVWTPGQPLLPAIVVAMSKEYILWRPRKDNGGGLLARARRVVEKDGTARYKWDKPNQTFDVMIEGKIKAKWTTKEFIDQDGLDQWGSEIPGDANSSIAASAHHNYVVYLPTVGTIAALSMSRSQVKKSKDLNYSLQGEVPIFAKKFLVGTVDETSDENKYKNWSIKPDGFVDEATFKKAELLFKNFGETGFVVEQDSDDSTPAGSGAGKATGSKKV